MSIPIVREGTFLMHEGGTKFYEVMLLHTVEHSMHLLIKRWGKTSAIHGGGEIQIAQFPNARKAQSAADTLISQKRSRGYERQGGATIGLHGYGGEITGGSAGNIHGLLAAHYGKLNAAAIVREFAPELAHELRGREITGVWIDELGDVVSEGAKEPAPEPERGEGWGSW